MRHTNLFECGLVYILVRISFLAIARSANIHTRTYYIFSYMFKLELLLMTHILSNFGNVLQQVFIQTISNQSSSWWHTFWWQVWWHYHQSVLITEDFMIFLGIYAVFTRIIKISFCLLCMNLISKSSTTHVRLVYADKFTFYSLFS